MANDGEEGPSGTQAPATPKAADGGSKKSKSRSSSREPKVPQYEPQSLAEAMATANTMDEGDFRNSIGELVSSCASAFDYQGFNPEVIRAEATRIFKEKLNSVLLLVGGTVCLRGTNLNKILNKSSEELVKAWDPFKDQFKHRASGRYSNKELTIARVAASWPLNMAMVADRVNRPVIEALKVAPKLLISTVYAPVSMTVGKEATHELAERVNLVFLLEFDKLINKKSPKPKDVVRYFKVAQNNPLVSAEQRKNLYTRLKIQSKLATAMEDPAFKVFVNNYPIPDM